MMAYIIFCYRLLSMFVVAVMVPKRMLVMSVLVCLAANILISVEGGQTANLLFLSAGLYGFGASWLYGSGVAWTAEHMDVVVSQNWIGLYQTHLKSFLA